MLNKIKEMAKYLDEKIKFIFSCLRDSSNFLSANDQLNKEAHDIYCAYFYLNEKVKALLEKTTQLDKDYKEIYAEYKSVLKSDKLFMKYGEKLPPEATE